jgi:hypothetical protein
MRLQEKLNTSSLHSTKFEASGLVRPVLNCTESSCKDDTITGADPKRCKGISCLSTVMNLTGNYTSLQPSPVGGGSGGRSPETTE